MIIQSLRQSGHERITLTFHDGNDFTTSLAVVTELRLFAGKELDEAQFETLKYRTSVSLARELGLELLSRRMHSRAELSEKLLRKGMEPSAVEEALFWLQDHQYLDDTRYASAIVRHYLKKGYGEQRIRSELYRRGIPRDYWDEALKELSGTEEPGKEGTGSRSEREVKACVS